MRLATTLALLSAFTLAACGEEKKEPKSAEEVIAEAGGLERQRPGDPLVLVLHPLHRRDDVGRHPRPQHRPQQPVLAGVMVVQ